MNNMQRPTLPVFNGKYEVISVKDESKSAKVYIARSIKDAKLVFVKVYKQEYLVDNLH
jgi:serine/threonine protein kinase